MPLIAHDTTFETVPETTSALDSPIPNTHIAPSSGDQMVKKSQTVRLIGVPMDLGASRRGVDMGPSAVRLADLGGQLAALGLRVLDDGNVFVPDRAVLSTAPLERLQAIARVASDVAQRVKDSILSGERPLVLGGDHSLAAGSAAGTATALAERGKRIGLIWLDAHADLNTPESSLTGNVHGMPVAHLLGMGDPGMSSIASVSPAVLAQHLVYIGLRDVDAAEKNAIARLGIRAFTMRDIDERGMRAVMADAIAIATNGTGGVHVSLDADFVDPVEAPGVGTPVRGGVTLREAHLAMEMLNDSGAMLAMDLVEINPILDRANNTAELACALVASAFGRRIL